MLGRKTMSRFKVIHCRDYIDSEGNKPYEDDYDCLLIDTTNNEIVFSDSMEPEDATLYRDLYPLVELLNKLAAEGEKA